jgi:hypothetical protein
MSFFAQVFSWTIRHSVPLLFGLVWITVTSAAAVWAAFSLRLPASSPLKTTRSIDPRHMWRPGGLACAFAALTFLGIFLAFYVTMILVWEDFAYYDNSQLTLLTLKGHNFPPQLDPGTGRFWPLGLQEFNLIRHFTNTITGYHVFPIIELLIFSGILLLLDDELGVVARAALVTLALLTPSVLFSFSSLVFVERNVLFFLVCLLLCVKRFEQTQSIAWAIAAIVSAQIMIYSKETAFLLLLGFAGSRLILRCRNEDVREWRLERLWAEKSRLDLCLASLATLFLIAYLVIMGIHGKMSYVDASRLPKMDVFLSYIKVDLLSWLLLVFFLVRGYLILRSRIPPLLFWDGLAFAGVAWFLGYLYLSIFSVYYTGPVDLIAILYIGRFIVLSWKQIRSWSKAAATLLAFIILFQDILVSGFAVYERKNVIYGKARIASVVEAQYRQGAGKGIRLFFPFSGGYTIMEFGAYLSSRGIPVEAAAGEISTKNSIVLAEARRTRIRNAPGRPAEDGPCVDWITIRCELVDSPAPGDLVIVLPDDEVSLAEVSVYREKGDLLLFSQPRLPTPLWLHRLFDSLPVGPESRYRDYSLPDRWMDESVTLWK